MTKMLAGKNKATPKTIKIIMDAIRSGASQRDASALAGISEDTLSLWKKQDSDFSEQMRQKEIQLPSGVVFDGEKFGTGEITSLFSAKDAFQRLLSSLVDPSGFEPLTSSLQMKRSTN
ncbi:MAG: Site-specific recombinase [Parcubacteria group bacterium]|nr:Site-specific recombinase [Parcubacteria group bacterium]